MLGTPFHVKPYSLAAGKVSLRIAFKLCQMLY